MYKNIYKKCNKEFLVKFKSKKRRYCSRNCYWQGKKDKPWFEVSDKLRKQRSKRRKF